MWRHALGVGRRQRPAWCSSSTAPLPSHLPGSTAALHTFPLSFPTMCIWGANTGIGKTLFSAGLAAAAERKEVETLYLKPVQTGFPSDSDARLVASASGGAVAAGPHAAALLPDGLPTSSTSVSTRSTSCSPGWVLAKTLYAWRRPVSPHLAVQDEGRDVADQDIVNALAAEAGSFEAAGLPIRRQQRQQQQQQQQQQRLLLVETAGGVASPGPSGTLQCDLLRPLRLPGLLVGDGRLGGISATLSALDTLLLRGYDVPLVVLMDEGLDNHRAIQAHVGAKSRVLVFPVCQGPPPGPADGPNAAAAAEAAAAAGAPGAELRPQSVLELEAEGLQLVDANLQAWLDGSKCQFDELLAAVQSQHEARLAALQSAAAQGRQSLWWPFTQHSNVRADRAVTVIDSRAGESFAVFQPSTAAPRPQPSERLLTSSSSSRGTGRSDAHTRTTGSTAADSGALAEPANSAAGPVLQLQYDACASWWTQGLSPPAQRQLVSEVAAAAGRYGHVMFPENVHAPALELAQRLLAGVGAGWASRVFFSDNGSTAIEVALKMAFRKFMSDHRLLDNSCELQVVGLRDGYHGDTLGAMEAVAPSPYTGRLQTPWYRGRGLFLDPPSAGIVDGRWEVAGPEELSSSLAGLQATDSSARGASATALQEFASREELFARGRDASLLAQVYLGHIVGAMERHATAHPDTSLGACILEPLVQGAGGMRLVDPLFQRVLVDECRRRSIPVILDEVFTGFYRLGELSAAHALGVTPDIACYAKLMTGGLLPLAATLATPEVFGAFQSDSKLHALLHGHSYTAHALGCAAGVASLNLLDDPALNPNLCTPDRPGACSAGGGCAAPCGRLRPLWDEGAVARLSLHPSVQRVMVLGTVVALELCSQGGGGYASDDSRRVVERLRSAGVYTRPLGNVVYLMVTPMTERTQCAELLSRLEAAL